ncbi:MAG: squalene--hopene cyclase [Candidatus Dormibacteria bacterium]
MTLDLIFERPSSEGLPARPDLQSALDRAVANLLSRQLPDGSWMGELESNAAITAEYLLMCRFLGVADPAREASALGYLRREQRPDGSFGIAPEVDGDISVTAEVFVAMRAMGVELDDPAVASARDFVAGHGGVHATRVFTRIWLALAGLWPWHELPVVPPEWILIPGTRMGSIYDLASWARATTVPLAILRSLETVFPLERPAPGELPAGPRVPAAGTLTWKSVDRLVRIYGKLPKVGLRGLAMAEAERWILEHQEEDGSWAGIQPPWVYGIMALVARGHRLSDPAVRRGLEALESFGIEDERGFRLQACVSPVWDTGLALWALCDAGLPPSHQAVRRAVDWLVAREVKKPGDWAVRLPGVTPGGWPFEFYNDQYPDTDDTAVVLCALTAAGHRRGDGTPAGQAMARALGWLVAMQGSDGGYAAFDADNNRRWVERLPISDFGEVLDPPSPDVTAHVVEALARCGGRDLALAKWRAVSWLRRSEEGEGAYYGRWGVNYVYGGAAVATALATLGEHADRERLVRLGRWVRDHQRADGGFGESVLSYHSPEHIGRGQPTPSQTAWALMALEAALYASPDLDSDRSLTESAAAAADWLLGHQQADGGWTDQLFTGTGFPRAFYLRYQMYATIFPVMALARMVEPGPALTLGG